MAIGIILAAGRGSRLAPLTDSIPKCMVSVCGKPMLHWQIDAMRECGITKIVVVAGYKHEHIRGQFTKIINKKWQTTNMVYSLLLTEEFLNRGECIISYSDIVYEANAIKTLLDEGSGDLSILYDTNWLDLWTKRFSNPLDDAESFTHKNGIVQEIGKPCDNVQEIKGQYMGLLKINPSAIERIFNFYRQEPNKFKNLDVTTLLNMYIRSGNEINAIPYSLPWCEVDSVGDLAVAEQVMAETCC